MEARKSIQLVPGQQIAVVALYPAKEGFHIFEVVQRIIEICGTRLFALWLRR